MSAITLLGGNGVLKPATVVGTEAVSYDKSKRVSQFSYIITADKVRADPINGLVNAIGTAPGFKTGLASLKSTQTSSSGALVDPGGAGVTSIVILDGVQMPSTSSPKDFLQPLDPYSIDFVEILIGPLTALYGVEGAGGVILVNFVHKDKEVAQVNVLGLTILYPKCYVGLVDFPVAVADRKRPAASPEQRSTLCWSANLLTDANGVARLNFFTPHEQSTYLATVFGITENGDLTSQKLQIKCQ